MRIMNDDNKEEEVSRVENNEGKVRQQRNGLGVQSEKKKFKYKQSRFGEFLGGSDLVTFSDAKRS